MLTSGESICAWMAAMAAIAPLVSIGVAGTVVTGCASTAAPVSMVVKPMSTRASSVEIMRRDSIKRRCDVMPSMRTVKRVAMLKTALTCGASRTPSLSIARRIAMLQSRILSDDQFEDDCSVRIAEMIVWSTESGSLRT